MIIRIGHKYNVEQIRERVKTNKSCPLAPSNSCTSASFALMILWTGKKLFLRFIFFCVFFFFSLLKQSFLKRGSPVRHRDVVDGDNKEEYQTIRYKYSVVNHASEYRIIVTDYQDEQEEIKWKNVAVSDFLNIFYRLFCTIRNGFKASLIT